MSIDVFRVGRTGCADTPSSPTPLIRLNDVPKLPWLPRRRGGGRLAVATVHRWCTRGVGGQRLRFVRVGAVRCTSVAWLNEFFEALSPSEAPAGPPGAGPVGDRAGRARQRAAAAERELRKEGF